MSKLSKLLLSLIFIALLATNAAAEQAPPAAESAVTATEPSIYLIRLEDAPLATYRGGIEGLSATSPTVTGERGINITSDTAVAYIDYLASQRADFVSNAQQALGRDLDVVFEYYAANNGLAVWLTPAEADIVANLDGVVYITPDEELELHTDNGPTWIGANTLWDGSNVPSNIATQGEGMVVGIIDTGINYSNPSFAAVGPVDGYVHTNPLGTGNYIGNCAPGGGYESYCNDKLIGVRGYTGVNGGDPVDNNGHGSHVASTAAGNTVEASLIAPTTSFTRTISGVAPHANIIAYSACCSSTALAAAIDDIVIDYGTLLAANPDVRMSVNYSIGTTGCVSLDPWGRFDSAGYLAARDAGIFVATSGGNCGPGSSTIGSPANAPWLTSVASSTHDRAFVNELINMSGGDTTPPADIQGAGIAAGYGPALVVYAGDFGDALCLAPFAAGTWTSGEIVVCDRGTNARVEKGQNVLAGGAGGMILADDGGGLVGDAHFLPAIHVTAADGTAIKTWLSSGAGHMATISGFYIDEDDSYGDIMSGFSSRGPNSTVFDTISPSVSAPGQDIFAAYGINNAIEWNAISGTSMASPHVAGAGALLMSIYPDWTPAEIQSALMLTGWQSLLKEDGATPTDHFDVGSGRIDLNVAAEVGFVLNETTENYTNANPAIGGDPKTLNLPSMADTECAGSCSWTRTIRSVASTAVDYVVTTNGPTGLNLTVTPSSFTLEAGDTLELTITADVSTLTPDVYAMGNVVITPQAVTTLGAGALLEEGFEDVTFPPAGWTAYNIDGDAWEWTRTTTSFYSGTASAFHRFGNDGGLDQVGWLVTPALTLSGTSATLDFAERTQWPGDYVYQGVWASTGSCDPNDGDFVEVEEVEGTADWRTLSIDLSAYASQTVCLGFNYGGVYASSWYIDDVVVTSGTAAVSPIATAHLPVAVIPTAGVSDPEIEVDPSSISSTQAADMTTNHVLSIGNVGGSDLTWNIDELPPVVLQLDNNNGETVSSNAKELVGAFAASNSGVVEVSTAVAEGGYLLSIDDGIAENGLGLTNGGEFFWANRFTPNPLDFPITLNEVQILFRTADMVSVGDAVDIYIYEDADGNPANGATHVASITGQTIQTLDSFSTYSTNAVFNGPGDILIAAVNRGSTAAGQFPASIDQTASQGRSWIGIGTLGDPPVLPLATFAVVDSLGFPGNWLVRGLGTSDGADCSLPSDVPWLSVSPASGTTPAGGSNDVTVSLDSTGLSIGQYNAFLCINSNDPVNPLVVVPVTLEVDDGTAPPAINVDPASLSSTQPADSVATQSFDIGNTGGSDLDWNIEEDAGEAIAGGWSDNFDSYAVGSGLHGQGGWEAWEGDLTWDAFVSDAQALSAPHSIDIVGDADVVHPFSGYTSGQWVITAQQYIPTGFTGQSYFIFLNTYGGTHNWSTQVMFDATTGNVINEGVSSGTLPFVTGEWVEIRMEIDLDNNTQAFYYGGDLLYTGTWTEEQSGGGALNLGALDLFANGASSVYYDDISLTPGTVTPVTCSAINDIPWASVSPTSGTTAAGASSSVDVTFDSTALAEGSYAGTLCIHSNDTANPLVELPVTLTVDNTAVVYAVDVMASPDALSGTVGSSVMYHVEVTNNGTDVDTFDISVAGNMWTSTPDMATITLNPGETGMVMVTVDIPATAVDGETDTVTVTATSQGDNTVSDSVDLTTTAEDDGVTPPTGYTIYLPVVIKP